MKCESICPYSVREDDTSGGHLGLEVDITYYSCGFHWPKKQFICRVAYEAEPNAECIQEFGQIPTGPKRVTPDMLEAKRLNDDFDAWDLMAGLPIDLYGN